MTITQLDQAVVGISTGGLERPDLVNESLQPSCDLRVVYRCSRISPCRVPPIGKGVG
jgi:hypothetical protein